MGGVNIPLPALSGPEPAQAPYPNALAEFQRASQLRTQAAQQQAITAQTQGQQQQNQMQGLQLQDEQLRRQLAPQFVKKDANGKPNGFDTEGLYNAMLQGGADPMSIQAMRMKQVEMQKALLGLSDANIEHQKKVTGVFANGVESIEDLWDKIDAKNQKAPVGSSPGTLGGPTPSAAPVPGMAGGAALPQSKPFGPPPPPVATPEIGSSPAGTPESMGVPAPGEAPTGSEQAIQAAQTPSPNAVPHEVQMAYQKFLISLDKQGIPAASLKPFLSSRDDLEQSKAELGLHAQMMSDRAELAKTQEAEGKGQQAEAEAAKANIISVPELGGAYHVKEGVFQPYGGGASMSPAMLESKYVMDQEAKQRTGKSPNPQFDAGFEKFKTLIPVANFNIQNAGAAADAGGNPSQVAQAIASGQMAWKDAVSPRTPMATKNAILSQVFKINPSFDTAEFGLEQDAAKKARSGAWADTRVAYNTAIDHSKQLLDTLDALNNGDVKALNSMKNFFKTEFGSPDVPDYSAVANAYNHEVTSVVSKGHITDAEVAQGGAVLPSNASPQQGRGVVQAFNQLMQSKRDELDKVIKAGAGNKANATLGVNANSETQQTSGHKVGDIIQQAGHTFKATKVDANGKVLAADPQ